MAKSLIGGAFGWLRGSIGAVTFTTSTAALDGKRRQVARQKVTEVKNPNSVSQILQRMRMAPAAKFYNALVGILDHSWEGVEYGAKSRLEFMRRAMQNDAAVYVPYGYKGFAPGEYEVSAGSLPSLPWRNELSAQIEGATNLSNVTPLTQQVVDFLGDYGVLVGDQITAVAVFVDEFTGDYKVSTSRLIVGVDNMFEDTGEASITFRVYSSGIWLGSDIAAIALIVSRGKESTTAKRSNEKMLLVRDYKNLLSLEAMNAAVESYQTKTEYNSLNSDWYLNQSSLQAFNGKVIQVGLNVPTAKQTDFGTYVNALGYEVVKNGLIERGVFCDAEGENLFYAADGAPIAKFSETGEATSKLTETDVQSQLTSLGYGSMELWGDGSADAIAKKYAEQLNG